MLFHNQIFYPVHKKNHKFTFIPETKRISHGNNNKGDYLIMCLLNNGITSVKISIILDFEGIIFFITISGKPFFPYLWFFVPERMVTTQFTMLVLLAVPCKCWVLGGFWSCYGYVVKSFLRVFDKNFL